jgi:hypothetical protein
MALEPGYNFLLCWVAQALQQNGSGTLAQSVEQRTFNPLVGSSSLPRPTKPVVYSFDGFQVGS